MFWLSFGFGILVGGSICWWWQKERTEILERKMYHLQLRLEQLEFTESSDAKLVKNVKIGR